MPESLIDVLELQERLRCGRSAAYALVAPTGPLGSSIVRVGRAVRVPESALAEFIRSGGARVIPKPAPNGTATATKPRTRAASR